MIDRLRVPRHSEYMSRLHEVFDAFTENDKITVSCGICGLTWKNKIHGDFTFYGDKGDVFIILHKQVVAPSGDQLAAFDVCVATDLPAYAETLDVFV
jgi:hypothetical protein